MKNLSRWISIILALTLIATVVGCSDPNNNGTTPTNGGDTNETVVPTIKELLENIPVSFTEYENNLRANEQRSVSRLTLTSNETQGFTTSACTNTLFVASYGSPELLLVNIVLTVLKTDISNLEGFEKGENFNIPDSFELSQNCLNTIETNFGFTPPYFEDYSWGILKADYENTKVKVFWKLNMINGDGTPSTTLLLISGTYEEGKYKELTSYFSYNFGFNTKGAVHYSNDGEKLISTISIRQPENLRENNSNWVSFRESNETEIYEQNKPFGIQNAEYTLRYSQSNNSYDYYIFDRNKYLVVEISGSENSENTYIPLSSINTNGKIITKSDSQISENTQYYIDDVYTSNIRSKQYNSQWYPCYVTQNSNQGIISVSDGFTFTKASTIIQAVQKMESMKQKIASSAIEPYYITDSEINSLENECMEWADNL